MRRSGFTQPLPASYGYKTVDEPSRVQLGEWQCATRFDKSHRRKPVVTAGFTLIETLVTLGIVLILVSTAFGSITKFRESSALDQAVDTTLGYLREAREKTLAAENASAWSVHFATTTVTLFRGGVYDVSDATNVVFTASGLLTMSNSLSTTTGTVAFERLSGASSVTGTVTFQGTRSGNIQRIQISSSGLSTKQ